MGRGGLTTARRPLLRLGAETGTPWRAPLVAAAGACALVCAAALLLAAAASVYVVVRTIGQLAEGDGDNAARWATMLFAAAAPILIAYPARAGYLGARARLRGESRPVSAGALAVAAPLAVIAGCVYLQGKLGFGSYFVTDDWLQITIAHDAVAHSGLNLHYLGRIVYIHYAPGHRFTYWLLDELAPLNWHAGIAAMLALFAGSLAVFHRICVRLFGRRPSNLVLLGLLGTSVLLVPSFLWFADAVHKFPSMLLCLVAIDAYLAYRLEGKRWALAVSVVAVGLGSLFYMKALLVPLYLLLIRVLFLERRPSRALRAIAADRWTWLAFVPVYAIYLINYFLNYFNTNEKTPPPSLHLLGKYLWLAWFRGVMPAFMGVHVGVDAHSPELLMAFAAQALLVVLIAYTLWRKRSAWRGWVFLAVAFAANASIVALGRLGQLGLQQVGAQLRYDTEMTWLLPLALGLALFPDVSGGRVGAETVRAVRWPGRRVRIGLVVAVACAYLAAAIDTGRDTAVEWHRADSDQPKAYVYNMQHTAAQLQRSGARLETLDDQTPAFLVSPAHKPWNRLERFVPAVAHELHVVPADPRPLQVRQDGEVIPIALQSLANTPSSLTGAGRVALSGGTRTRRGGKPCARAGARPATIAFRTEKILRGESLFARLGYRVVRGGGAPMRVTGNTYRPGAVLLPLTRTHGQAYLNLGHRLRAELPPGSEVCLRSSQVGWIAP
jgi:hypothetical protein